MPALRFRVKICLNLALKFSLVLRQTECCSRKSFFLNTLEPEVLQRSDASQNDHKSKGYLHVKSDKNDLKRLGYPTFIRLFKIRLNNPSMNISGQGEVYRTSYGADNPTAETSFSFGDQFNATTMGKASQLWDPL